MSLVKVVRTGFRGSEMKRRDALGANGDDVVLMLEDAFDQHEAHRHQFDTIFFEQVGCDDGVGDPGLVFQAQKYESMRGARPLASDDAAGSLHPFSIGRGLEFECSQYSLLAQFGALILHGVRADGEAGTREISEEPLFGVHLRQRRGRVELDDVVKQRADWLRGARDLPESVAAMK